MTPSKLVVDRIRVVYGSTVILDDFSLEVSAGETVAVIGPSGSGKSTLLRAIAGLEPLASGRILLDGADIAAIAPHRRGVGLMFQDHALFPHLSVADNIGYGLDRAGLAGTERQARIKEMLELVGLSDFGLRPIDQLSGGEAQRVALARALAPSPDLLMLDEPLGSLDRVLRDQLIDDLDQLLHQMGQTSLHVTHDQAEAAALADRVAVLADGALVADGTPKQLWDNPRNRFVADFLGRPNIWSLDVAPDSTHGEAIVWAEAGMVVGQANNGAALPQSAVVPVDAIGEAPSGGGVRPEDPTIVGTVVGSRFHQGRYRHRVRVGASANLQSAADRDSAKNGGHTLVFVDDRERKVGERVELVADLSAAIPIVG